MREVQGQESRGYCKKGCTRELRATAGESQCPAGVGEGRSGVLLQGGGDRTEGINYTWEGKAVSHGGGEGDQSEWPPIVFKSRGRERMYR